MEATKTTREQAAEVMVRFMNLHPIAAAERVERLLDDNLAAVMAQATSREAVYDVLDQVEEAQLQKQQAAIAAMARPGGRVASATIPPGDLGVVESGAQAPFDV